jgi:hypothetical protein
MVRSDERPGLQMEAVNEGNPASRSRPTTLHLDADTRAQLYQLGPTARASAAVHQVRDETVAKSDALRAARRLQRRGPCPHDEASARCPGCRAARVPSACRGCGRGTTPGHLRSMEGKRRGRGRM